MRVESRLTAPSDIERERVTRALVAWLAQHAEWGGHRYRTALWLGVSSYAALRYYMLLASDRIVEVKDERDGIAIHGVPDLEPAEWTTPAECVVDTQCRSQLGRDGDKLLGAADLSPLPFRDYRPTRREYIGRNAFPVAVAIRGALMKGNDMFTLKNMIGTIAALSLAACAVDEGTDDQLETSQAEQDTSGTGFWVWQRPTNLPTSDNYHTIGSSSGQTCFLSGLVGSMASAYGDPEPPNTLYTTASAGVTGGNGSPYKIEAFSGITGVALGARAVCPNTVAGRSKLYYFDSDSSASAVRMASSTGTICALTEIEQPGTLFGPQDFADIADELTIFESGGYWYLGGSGHAAGYAQCIDVTARSVEWNVNNGTVNLSQGADKQCFLTGLKGIWQTSDFSTGAWIDYDSGLLQWSLTVTGNKHAWARCMR